MLTRVKEAARRGFLRGKEATKASGRVRVTVKKHTKRVAQATKKVHHHVAVRPHDHLVGRWNWYAWWHTRTWYKVVNALVLFASLFGMMSYTYKTFASIGDTKIWTFNNTGEYTYDSDSVESNSNDLRLKLRDIVQNFTVSGGKLQSNNVIDVTADDTYYFVGTDLGIDVIRQDTWERSAYITSGGGFTTIEVANGYLYAGKNGGIYRWQISALANNTALGSPRYSTSTSPALASQNIRKISANKIANKVYLAVASVGYAELIKDEQGVNTIVKVPVPGGYTTNAVAISDDGALYYDIRNTISANSAVLEKYNAINQVADWTYNTNNVDFGSNLAPLHGPDPSNGFVTGIRVTSGTSTANSGDNTIYIETEAGLSVIQENRTTQSSGTVNNFTTASRGSNLVTGASAQGRFGAQSNAAQSIDNSTGSYYVQSQTQAEDWLEYDLTSSKTFNFLKQYFWSTANYTPSSYVVESSTQGTSTNLAPTSTQWAPWSNSGFSIGGAADNAYGTAYYTGFATNVIPQPMYEQSFASNQAISGVDLQFYDQNTSAKNYTIQGSTKATTTLTPSTVTASSTNSSNTASLAIDRSASTRWLSNVATNTAAQWLQLDYGSTKTIEGISFVDATTITDYSVDYSNDGTNWTSAYSTTGNSSGSSRIKFSSPVTGRYLRINVTRSYSPTVTTAVSLYEVEAYSSMFESGTVTTLDTITNNSDIARFSNFSSTSVKAVRALVTSTYGVNANFGIREMKTYQTTFGGGAVTQLSSVSGLNIPIVWQNNVSHDVSFNSTTARYLRVKYTGYANTGLLVSEVELNNTTLPEFAPSRITGSTIDPENNH